MHNTVNFFRCYNVYFTIPIWLFLLGLHVRTRRTFVYIYSVILVDEQIEDRNLQYLIFL